MTSLGDLEHDQTHYANSDWGCSRGNSLPGLSRFTGGSWVGEGYLSWDDGRRVGGL